MDTDLFRIAFRIAVSELRLQTTATEVGVTRPLIVGIIGMGSVGSALVAAIENGDVDAVVVGIMRRSPSGPRETSELDWLLACDPDVVIEVADASALAAYGPVILRSGVDLVATSYGALADPAVYEQLFSAARYGGRFLLSTGAIGGLDIIRALVRTHLTDVSIKSTVLPSAIGWRMPVSTSGQLVRSGSVRELILEFPLITNVMALVGLATLGLDDVTGELWISAGQTKSHEIVARSNLSTVSIKIENRLVPGSVRSSAIVVDALYRYLVDRDSTVLLGA